MVWEKEKKVPNLLGDRLTGLDHSGSPAVTAPVNTPPSQPLHGLPVLVKPEDRAQGPLARGPCQAAAPVSRAQVGESHPTPGTSLGGPHGGPPRETPGRTPRGRCWRRRGKRGAGRQASGAPWGGGWGAPAARGGQSTGPGACVWSRDWRSRHTYLPGRGRANKHRTPRAAPRS